MKNDYSISSTRFYYFMCFYTLFYDYYQTFSLFSRSLSVSWVDVLVRLELNWSDWTTFRIRKYSIWFSYLILSMQWICSYWYTHFFCCRVFSIEWAEFMWFCHSIRSILIFFFSFLSFVVLLLMFHRFDSQFEEWMCVGFFFSRLRTNAIRVIEIIYWSTHEMNDMWV